MQKEEYFDVKKNRRLGYDCAWTITIGGLDAGPDIPRSEYGLPGLHNVTKVGLAGGDTDTTIPKKIRKHANRAANAIQRAESQLLNEAQIHLFTLSNPQVKNEEQNGKR